MTNKRNPSPLFLLLVSFSPIFFRILFFMTSQKSYRVLLALVALWSFLIALPPLLAALEIQQASGIIYKFFSRICHQEESRSLSVFGYTLGICARCSMIYLGFFIGMIVAGFWSNRGKENFKIVFTVVLLPMLLDVTLDAFGLHRSTMITRVITGLVFGLGCGVLLTPMLIDGLHQFATKAVISK